MCEAAWLGALADWLTVATAFGALLLGASEWRSARAHNRLSVRPHLSFDYLLQTTDPQIRIVLANNGIGPAFIKSFQVSVRR
jgi:hypothetical protein